MCRCWPPISLAFAGARLAQQVDIGLGSAPKLAVDECVGSQLGLRPAYFQARSKVSCCATVRPAAGLIITHMQPNKSHTCGVVRQATLRVARLCWAAPKLSQRGWLQLPASLASAYGLNHSLAHNDITRGIQGGSLPWQAAPPWG